MTMDDKTVLVTGGTRGIGRAIVEAFAAAGARVAFTYRSSTGAAAALEEALRSRGASVMSFQGDVGRMESATEAVDGVMHAWGRLDVLVNNAGITRDGLLVRMAPEDWDAVLAANLRGMFNFCKAAYRPMMRQRSGRIINISSVSGIMGNAGQANYAAAKAGVFGFTKSLAKELGARKVTVNAVAPGYVDTEMTAGLGQAVRKDLMKRIPLRRVAAPEEIAQPVLFLASDAAGYITGHTLVVDGGLAM